MSEPYLLESADVLSGGNVVIQKNSGKYSASFQRGRSIGPLPTLYDGKANFVIPANTWFFYLKAQRHLKDISSSAKGLLMYWSFLEANDHEWNKFPVLNDQKPSYQFRNLLIDMVRNGDIKKSTADTYMRAVIRFYKWAIYEEFLPYNDDNKPFDVEYVSVSTRKPDIFDDTEFVGVTMTGENNS